jgi:HK97 family phage major capsid protein
MGITQKIEDLRKAPKAAWRGQTGLGVEELKEARGERLDEAAPLVDKAKGDNRPMLASEQRAFDRLMAEADEIDGMINRLELDNRARVILPAHQFENRGGATGGARDRELRIMGESLFTKGGAMVPDAYAAEVWSHLSAEAVLLKAGARVIETDRSNLLIPRLAADSIASWTGEGVEITESSPTMSGVDAILHKCASIVRVSNELIADANPSVLDMLMQQLTRSLSLAVDLAGFEGTGSSYQPKGMSGHATNVNIGLGADGAVPGDLDEIADAIGAIETANGKASAVFMHPAIWAILSKIKTDSAATRNEPLLLNTVGVDAAPVRRLYGVPVYLTSQLSTTEKQGSSALVCSSIYVCDMSQIVFVRHGQIRLELDRSRLFNSDEGEVRAVLRAVWAFPNPTAITRIKGVKQA